MSVYSSLRQLDDFLQRRSSPKTSSQGLESIRQSLINIADSDNYDELKNILESIKDQITNKKNMLGDDHQAVVFSELQMLYEIYRDLETVLHAKENRPVETEESSLKLLKNIDGLGNISENKTAPYKAFNESLVNAVKTSNNDPTLKQETEQLIAYLSRSPFHRLYHRDKIKRLIEFDKKLPQPVPTFSLEAILETLSKVKPISDDPISQDNKTSEINILEKIGTKQGDSTEKMASLASSDVERISQSYKQPVFGKPEAINSRLIDKHRSKQRKSFEQGKDFRNGINFQGSCYGYVQEYVRFKNFGNSDIQTVENLKLSKEVDRAQTDLNDRIKDQQTLVSKRVGRKKIETNIDKRAQGLLNIVNNHQGKDLRVHISSPDAAHAVYIKKEADGKIEFFDPNFGVYQFKNDDEFKKFYTDLHHEYVLQNTDYAVYEALVLTPKEEAPKQGLISQLSGKFTTLLTGSKFFDSSYLKQGILTPFFNDAMKFRQSRNLKESQKAQQEHQINLENQEEQEEQEDQTEDMASSPVSPHRF